VKVYEFVNEYSSDVTSDPNRENFIQMVKQGIAAMRAACADALAAYDPFDFEDTQALLEVVSPEELDLVVHHVYSPLDAPKIADSRYNVENFAALLSELGLDGKPVWATEFDLHNHAGATINPPSFSTAADQEDNARWFVQTTAWAFGTGLWAKFIYSEIATPMDDQRLQWSNLLDRSAGDAPRQIYHAFRKMRELLDPFTAAETLSLGTDLYGFQFTVGSRVAHVVWAKEGSGAKTGVTLSGLSDASAVLIRSVPDASGTFASELRTIENGTLSFDLADSTPLYIVPLFILLDADSVTVPEGGTASLRVSLSAPPPAAVTVQAAWVSGDPDISVSAGASLTFTAADWNVPQTLTLAAAADDDRLNGTATIRLSAAGLDDRLITATESDNLGDADGDGFSDVWETMAGSDPFDGSDFPAQRTDLTVAALQLKDAFPSKKKGAIRLRLVLTRPETVTTPQDLANRPFGVSLPGISETFFLDEKLRETSRKKFRLKGKLGKVNGEKVYVSETLTADVTLTGLDLTELFEALGIAAAEGKQKLAQTADIQTVFGGWKTLWSETVADVSFKITSRSAAASYKTR
jgi:hypothetical protein